jgi:hypothetical protein
VFTRRRIFLITTRMHITLFQYLRKVKTNISHREVKIVNSFIVHSVQTPSPICISKGVLVRC